MKKQEEERKDDEALAQIADEMEVMEHTVQVQG